MRAYVYELAKRRCKYFFHATLDSICFMHINSLSLRKKSCQSESTTDADRISMFIYACFRTSSASFQPPLHMHVLLLKTSILIAFLGQDKPSRTMNEIMKSISTGSSYFQHKKHKASKPCFRCIISQMGSSIQDSPLECTR